MNNLYDNHLYNLIVLNMEWFSKKPVQQYVKIEVLQITVMYYSANTKNVQHT